MSMSMMPVKIYIGKSFVGKMIHLKCDCLVNIDVQGPCVGYGISNNEIVLNIKTPEKLVSVGLNNPKLNIEIL